MIGACYTYLAFMWILENLNSGPPNGTVMALFIESHTQPFLLILRQAVLRFPKLVTP